jgi:tetratricopeptide (TPR) repeat protein
MLIDSEVLDSIEDDAETQTSNAWRYYHNLGVAYFYGHPMRNISYERQKDYFEKALQLAPDKIWQAYTALHYAQLLLQHQETDAALQILQATLSKQLSEAADKSIKTLTINVLMAKIDHKPESRDISAAEELLHELLDYYEEHHEYVQQVLLLMDASHLADIQGYRTEAYGYLNQAISLLQREKLPQLAAQAIIQKNKMMNSWVGLAF